MVFGLRLFHTTSCIIIASCSCNIYQSEHQQREAAEVLLKEHEMKSVRRDAQILKLKACIVFESNLLLLLSFVAVVFCLFVCFDLSFSTLIFAAPSK